jgi:hypothetical protein
MTANLHDACQDIGPLLARAAALITQPDADGTQGGGKPGSAPPWNPAAAAAYYDAPPFLRGLEASMRLAVTGHPGQARGGSDGNTRAALKAIESFAWPLRRVHETAPVEYDEHGRPRRCRCAFCRAGQQLARLVTTIRQLPAIGEDERPRKLPGAICPYCRFEMMWTLRRDYDWLVYCTRYGTCADEDGNPPKGYAVAGRLGPCVEWSDGLVT